MRRKFLYASTDEALKKTLSLTSIKPGLETVPVQDAYKRVLAEDIISPVNIPERDTSYFDGYAVRAEDTAGASSGRPVTLKVLGRIILSEGRVLRVSRGEACYVSTGTAIPEGTDAVVPVERTMLEENRVKVIHKVDRGEHVIPAGDDVRKGQVVLKRQHILRAQDTGLLATLKIGDVKVFKKPLVAIVPVGDELTTRLEEVGPKKVYASHGLIISSLIKESGGIPVQLDVAPDNPEKIGESILSGLGKADMVITIGGSSVGEKDFVAEAVNRVGSPGMVVHGLKIKPGRVTGLGVVNGKPVVLLPGLILSTIVGYYSLAQSLILLGAGIEPESYMPPIEAKMGEEIRFKEYLPFEKVTFVHLSWTKQGFVANPVFGESAYISVLAKADGFIITPEKRSVVEEGEVVEVHLIPGLSILENIRSRQG